jgi:hypothetical protein
MHPKALAMTKHRQVIAPTSRMFYFQDFLSDCKVHKEKTRNEERNENVRERRDDNLHERGKKKVFPSAVSRFSSRAAPKNVQTSFA